MKKILLTAALVLVASSALAVITGSKHDMTTTGASSAFHNTTDTNNANQLCVYCHTPHNNKKSALLWNRNDGATLTYYNKAASSTLNYAGNITAIADSSMECMSCHDGTVAVDSYASHTGNKLITGSANITTNLTKTHPVGFVYDATLTGADGNLAVVSADAKAVNSALGGGATLPLFGATHTMECATCHDVHGKVQQSMFLRVNNAGSNLCLSCHKK